MDASPGNESWRKALLNNKESSASATLSPPYVYRPSYLAEVVEEETPTIEWVLEKALIAVKKHGVRGLVVDPYNELDHSRPKHITETEYVSSMLSKVKRFAQRYDVHVWFVAHPRQLQDWQGKPPSLYDISGSAHFINKADNGIIVHRDWEDVENGVPEGGVRIIVQKARNKAAGKLGEHKLIYDRETGIYTDSKTI